MVMVVGHVELLVWIRSYTVLQTLYRAAVIP